MIWPTHVDITFRLRLGVISSLVAIKHPQALTCILSMHVELYTLARS